MKMKLGAKIGMGFGVLIMIAVILGGLAVFNMNSVSTESRTLAREYVPEVDVGAKIRGAANRLMYAMRGYGFTEQETYYQQAQKELKALKSGVEAGRELDSKAQELTKLGPALNKIEQAAGEYEQAMGQTHDLVASLAEYRDQLDANAQTYMQASASFLEDQNQDFKKDLRERQEKIALVSSLVDLGSQARVLNFKAQAADDMSLMQEAVGKLDEVDAIVADLRQITRDQEDINRIQKIVSAAKGYQEAMRGYLQNAGQGMDMAGYRQEMDANAASYVQNCDAFLKGQQKKLTTDMTERHTKITLANDVIDIGNAARVSAFKSQAKREPEIMNQGMQKFEQLEDTIVGLREITREKADLDQIDTVEQAGANYKQAMQGFLQEWKELQSLGQTRGSLGSTMIESCRELAAAALQGTKDIANMAMNSLSRASWVMIVGLIVALLVGVLIAYFLTRSITKPINRIVQGLRSSGEQVSAASAQVASSSQSSAEGANEQASSLEESSSSLEEMASQIKHNADNAEQADQAMKDTGRVVDSGVESMQRMGSAINEIKDSSSETSKIIKTIDDIAFQTNLLALNAAVEAARAGEAGKGFAVVAEEVRNLAQRSAEAAQNTAQLIEKSQENANNGVQVSEEVSGQLSSIKDSADKVNALVGEISAASKEQSQGIEQVNTAVAEMDKVVQQNASDAEESASAAEELSSQAAEMERMVEELAALIDGGAQQAQSTQRRTQKADQSSSQGNPRHAAPQKVSARGDKQQTPGNAHSSGPEKMIPLDDNDFKDF